MIAAHTDYDTQTEQQPCEHSYLLTHEVHLGTVTPEVSLIGVGRVAFILPGIPGLEIGDVQ